MTLSGGGNDREGSAFVVQGALVGNLLVAATKLLAGSDGGLAFLHPRAKPLSDVLELPEAAAVSADQDDPAYG